ncbi:hypothetical protein ACA910_014553 [Epithemia clementina (nom. ined.)]
MYYGSRTGAFRHFPAVRFKTCGDYDPRVRPWYVAASSGPKNVVMILDVSGSMQDNNKIGLLKEAASRVTKTLTTSDRVAIITFSNGAYDITGNGGYMATASYEKIDDLLGRISRLEAQGGTNFMEAFDKAFDILNASIPNDATVNCNTAIVFFTDGEMTQPEGVAEQDVIELIDSRIQKTGASLNQPIFLFTYSVPGTSSEINEFPSQLACSVPNGVWSKIEDERKIVESLSSYYKLFTLGLGADVNKDFVAWVEPYKFASVDVVGTTVSVPVYDRSKEPALFVGVVGIDFVMRALNKALGVTDGSSDESIRRVVERSTARCPRLDLGDCLLESYRRSSGAGDLALCPSTNNCTESDFIQIEEQKCPTISDYTKDVWINVDKMNVSVSEATCCSVAGQDIFADTCPYSGASGALVPSIASAFGFAALMQVISLAACP